MKPKILATMYASCPAPIAFVKVDESGIATRILIPPGETFVLEFLPENAGEIANTLSTLARSIGAHRDLHEVIQKIQNHFDPKLN